MNEARPRIHLIEKRGYIKKLKDREREYESGWWVVSEETAQSLIGGLIFFHEAKTKPSFFGGTILGFRIETEGEYQDRIIVRFESSLECKNVKAGAEGWAQAMKIVRGQ
jgi:hypothetical protein